MKIKIKARLSFPDLFTAVQYEGTGPFSYRCSLLVAEGSKEYEAIAAAVSSVAKETWGAKSEETIKKARSGKTGICFNDGNEKEYDGYAGHWVLTATRNQEKGRPTILDRDGKTPLTAEDGKPYAGCYVNAVVDIWPQNNKFGQTVRCQLLGLQFAEDGDAFSGGAAATESDFEALGDSADDPM